MSRRAVKIERPDDFRNAWPSQWPFFLLALLGTLLLICSGLTIGRRAGVLCYAFGTLADSFSTWYAVNSPWWHSRGLESNPRLRRWLDREGTGLRSFLKYDLARRYSIAFHVVVVGLSLVFPVVGVYFGLMRTFCAAHNAFLVIKWRLTA